VPPVGLEEITNITFHDNPFRSFRVVASGQTYMVKLVVASQQLLLVRGPELAFRDGESHGMLYRI
jgi:hypothetical protein